MPQFSRRNLALWVVGAVALALVIIAVYEATRPAEAPVSSPVQTPNPANTSTTPSAPTQPAGTPTSFSLHSQLSYEQAVAQFADRRIQFNPSCEAIPSSFTIKNNSEIMLDNRSTQVRTIGVDTKKYTITAWHFAIINLASSILPHTVIFTCDQQKNVAQVLLQR